jgi:hypothetical protein
VGIVGELGLEGELVSGVLAGVVELCSPCGECAECLDVSVAGPPLVFEVLEVVGVAAV